VSLQEYELETMFVAVSGIEQRILHSSMSPRRLLRRIGGSDKTKRERVECLALQQLSQGGERYSLVHLGGIPCPNPAHRGLWVGGKYFLGQEDAI
jgi:hypothetical protein